MVPRNELSLLCIAMCNLWRAYEPCCELGVPMNLISLYLSREFIYCCDESSATCKGSPLRVVVAYACVILLYLIRALKIHGLTG